MGFVRACVFDSSVFSDDDMTSSLRFFPVLKTPQCCRPGLKTPSNQRPSILTRLIRANTHTHTPLFVLAAVAHITVLLRLPVLSYVVIITPVLIVRIIFLYRSPWLDFTHGLLSVLRWTPREERQLQTLPHTEVSSYHRSSHGSVYEIEAALV